jgi:murein DD-endopeptidase
MFNKLSWLVSTLMLTLLGLAIALVVNQFFNQNLNQAISQGFSQPGSSRIGKFEPKFGLPIKCELGKDCFVQLYSDRDPGKSEIDWGCGRLTYDGHGGTDFAIPSQAAINKGVPVLAAAKGKVLRIRDGVSDRPLKDRNDPRVKGQECGNGLVIEHGDGWQTQYCHLRQGSVLVKPGDSVNLGSQLGLVGQSGMASFPHVHFEVRNQSKVVDPFMGENNGNSCQIKGRSLESSLWQNPLPYISTGQIDAGFSDSILNVEQAEQGNLSLSQLPKDAANLIFWIRAYGVLEGDEEKYQIIAPDRTIFIDRIQKITKSNKSWFGYIGKRNRQTLAKGEWQGKYSLSRNGKTVFQINRQFLVN